MVSNQLNPEIKAIESAQRNFRRSVIVKPKNTIGAYYNLGLTYELRDQDDKAKTAYLESQEFERFPYRLLSSIRLAWLEMKNMSVTKALASHTAIDLLKKNGNENEINKIERELNQPETLTDNEILVYSNLVLNWHLMAVWAFTLEKNYGSASEHAERGRHLFDKRGTFLEELSRKSRTEKLPLPNSSLYYCLKAYLESEGNQSQSTINFEDWESCRLNLDPKDPIHTHWDLEAEKKMRNNLLVR
jgi:hypothetical protein